MTGALLGAPMGAMGQQTQVPGKAAGDSTATHTESGILEDVVVTARRREERLQDVPLAISALTPEQLEQKSIARLTDLSGVTPSLVVEPGHSNGRTGPTIQIRGVTEISSDANKDSPVGFYFNDVAIQRVQGLNLSFFDIESVQVLKGPQGTLFGRNTTGGAVLVNPSKPTKEFGGDTEVSVGNLGTQEVNAVINGPVKDIGAVRVAAHWRQTDGFVTDVVTGKKVDGNEEYGVRLGFDLNPSDTWHSLTFFNYAKVHGGGTGYRSVGYDPTAALGSAAVATARNYPAPISPTLQAEVSALPFYDIDSGLKSHENVRTWSVDNTTQFDLNEHLSIKNIVAYRDMEEDLLDDYDGLPVSISHINFLVSGDQVSEELQLQGNYGRVKFITGAYYFKERVPFESIIALSELYTPIQNTILTNAPAYSITGTEVENQNSSIFGEADISLTDALTATIGARYSWDDRTIIAGSRTNAVCRFTIDDDNNPATPEVRPGPSAAQGCRFESNTTSSAPSYNLGLKYELFDKGIIYVAHRRGYKSGGLNARGDNTTELERSYRPEIVNDYELGLKMDFPLGTSSLTTNLAGYVSKFTDMQRSVNQRNRIPPIAYVANAAKATIQGFEAELALRTPIGFELSGHYSYTDAKFDKFNDLNGDDLTKVAVFPLVAKNLYGVTARQTLPTWNNGSTLSFGASLTHQSEVPTFDNFDPFLYLAPHDVVNADVLLENAFSKPLEIRLYAQNLLDEEYYRMGSNQYGGVSSLGMVSRTYGLPRTYGVSLKYMFGR